MDARFASDEKVAGSTPVRDSILWSSSIGRCIRLLTGRLQVRVLPSQPAGNSTGVTERTLIKCLLDWFNSNTRYYYDLRELWSRTPERS